MRLPPLLWFSLKHWEGATGNLRPRGLSLALHSDSLVMGLTLPAGTRAGWGLCERDWGEEEKWVGDGDM